MWVDFIFYKTLDCALQLFVLLGQSHSTLLKTIKRLFEIIASAFENWNF
jgi:hypothetical protein